jgi:hypothetical protein
MMFIKLPDTFLIISIEKYIRDDLIQGQQMPHVVFDRTARRATTRRLT